MGGGIRKLAGPPFPTLDVLARTAKCVNRLRNNAKLQKDRLGHVGTWLPFVTPFVLDLFPVQLFLPSSLGFSLKSFSFSLVPLISCRNFGLKQPVSQSIPSTLGIYN